MDENLIRVRDVSRLTNPLGLPMAAKPRAPVYKPFANARRMLDQTARSKHRPIRVYEMSVREIAAQRSSQVAIRRVPELVQISDGQPLHLIPHVGGPKHLAIMLNLPMWLGAKEILDKAGMNLVFDQRRPIVRTTVVDEEYLVCALPPIMIDPLSYVPRLILHDRENAEQNPVAR